MKQIGRIPSPQERAKPHWRRYVNDSLLALGGGVLVTSLIAAGHLYPRIPTISLVYLLVVVALASPRGLYAASLASLLAVLAFDYFLVLPLYTFVVSKFEDLLTLSLFLAPAVITSQMASAQRRSAEEARGRERETRLLYEQAQELAALRDRQRLPRELHDSVSQALYGISLWAHTVREALESSELEQAQAAIEDVLTLAEAGLAEMHALIFELRPESLETEGLVAALTKQIESARARHGLEIIAEWCGEPELPYEVKEVVYRIAQEALNNVTKHAKARRVDVRMSCDDGEVTLEVRDDGVGFASEDSFPGHLGLRSMRERATNVGGRVEVESAPLQGTRIRLRIPLTQSAA